MRDDRLVADRPFLDRADLNQRRDRVTEPLAVDAEDVAEKILDLGLGRVANRCKAYFASDIGLGGEHRARWLARKNRRRLVDGVAGHLDGRQQKIALLRWRGIPKGGYIFKGKLGLGRIPLNDIRAKPT